MVKRLTAPAILLALLALLLLATPGAQAQVSPTATYTPVATRAAAGVSGQTYTLASGNTLTVQRSATLGDAVTITILLLLLAAVIVRSIYDVAVRWIG